MSSDVGEDLSLQVDSEDELDWEEVDVPEHEQHLEITLDAAKPKKDATANKKKGISHAERLIRIDCHKIHTIALISNARARNQWINDPLLHARLISLTPLHLQNAFGAIHKSRVPDQNQRGRMFERAMENLTNWWIQVFFEVIPEGHLRNRTYDEIQRQLEARGLHATDEQNPKDATPMDEETLEDIIGQEGEPMRSVKSLMKHALNQSGSRDTSAQLFTALCRGLGIPARLVVSIQSVPWQAGIGKPKPKYSKKPKLKGKEFVANDVEVSSNPGSTVGSDFANGRRLDDETVLPMSDKAKGKQKAKPMIKLRKTKSKGHVLGAGPSRLEPEDPLTSAPVFWTEVFSRPDSKWFPIDPIRGTINKRKTFDPTTSTSNPSVASRFKVENRMLYVLAFEEDGYARDVTRRYAKQYGAKVAKMQGGSSAPNVGGGGKARQAWWDRVINAIHRPFQLHRDDLEDQELDVAQLMEGMPTTVSGFKDHPLYALERHLKQTETIYPAPPVTPELGKFRGEPVYPRSSVVSLKTAENWMRSSGRSVKPGEQPMKMVKVRAGTVNRMRELEVLKDELKVAGEDGEGSTSIGDIMQGLYAYSQTEAYVPDPVVDGIVPKNNFGNIDLYVPSMLPEGGVHVPFKGVAKIARKLGFDFAEAVTGFEFKKRRAFPIIEGVVVAAENEATLLEAFWEAEREADEKARIKKEDRVLKQWTRLIHGLRIRQKLQEQYGNKSNTIEQLHQPRELDVEVEVQDEEQAEAAGGFLAGADRVVTAFHLPKTKNTHVVFPSSTLAPPMAANDGDEKDEANENDLREEPELRTYDLEEDDGGAMDVDLETAPASVGTEAEVSLNGQQGVLFVPKTMQQLAEDAAKRAKEGVRHIEDEVEDIMIRTPIAAGGSTDNGAVTRTSGRQTRARARASGVNGQAISTPTHASGTINGGSAISSTKKTRPKASGSKKPTKSTKKRKRDSEDEDEDEDVPEGEDSDEDVRLDADEDDDQDDEDDFSPSKRPSRRGRGARSNGTPATPLKTLKSGPSRTKRGSAAPATSTISPSIRIPPRAAATVDATADPTPSKGGRTLRSRTSKTKAQLEDESKMEDAYRRAVAE